MIRLVLLFVALPAMVTGCRTLAPLPAVDLSEPGWTLREGQALWQSKRDAPEIAGELLLATNPDGRALLQFTKTPLPFVTVQTSNELWQIEFVPQQRRFSGQDTPAARLLWVHLARALSAPRAALQARGFKGRWPEPLRFEFTGQHSWELENRDTGEMISGFLNP